MRKSLTWLLLTLALTGSAQSLSSHRTHFKAGYFIEPGTLESHIVSYWGRGEAIPLASINYLGGSGTLANNAVWNTNWTFYGKEGFTAISHAYTNGAPDPFWVKRCTLVSRVVALQCAHTFNAPVGGTNGLGTNRWYLFIDSTNGQHWRRVVASRSQYEVTGLYNDVTALAFDTPLPATIEPMALLSSESPAVTNRPGWNPATQTFTPRFLTIQHAGGGGNALNYNRGATTIGSTTNGFMPGSGTTGFTAGDSGSPSFICVSNRLLYTPMYGWGGMSNVLWAINNATTNAGYTTNAYPVTVETLEGFQ